MPTPGLLEGDGCFYGICKGTKYCGSFVVGGARLVAPPFLVSRWPVGGLIINS